MKHRYEAFGLAIGSDRPLPGLQARGGSGVDVEIHFAKGRAPAIDSGAAETTALVGSGTVRECDDGGRLLTLASHGGESAWSMRVAGDGGAIEVRWRGPIELADVAAFVEVSGLSTALGLRGVPLLHGCAVDPGAGAFLALGAGGSGKSTLAAAALRRGYSVLSDDVAALNGSGPSVRVHPGGRQLRMNDDTARALGWDPAGLPRVFATPTLPPKRFVPLALDADARDVAAVFVLGPRGSGPVEIQRLAPAAALTALLRNTFGARTVDARRRARLLPFWTRFAGEVPVYGVRPPTGLDAVAALLDDLATHASHG